VTGDGREILRLEGHSGPVTAVAFSPDDTLALTGGADRTVRLWSRRDGKQIWMSGDLASGVSSVAFSPDARYALIGSHLVVHVRDIKKDREVYRLQGHTNGVSSVTVSPGGRFVLTGSLDNTARLWAIETGKEIRRFEGHTDSVTVVAFSSDELRVLTASQDGTARLWDVASAREVRRFDHKNKKEGVIVSSACISPDGRIVYTASQRVAWAWMRMMARLFEVSRATQTLSAQSLFPRSFFYPDRKLGRHRATVGRAKRPPGQTFPGTCRGCQKRRFLARRSFHSHGKQGWNGPTLGESER